MKNILIVAKILKPHGIRGAVKIQPLIDDDMPFSIFRNVFLGDTLKPAKITNVTRLNNAYAVALDCITDTATAETYRNQLISIDRNEYAEYFKDTLLVADLLGAEVSYEDGSILGYIVNVEQYGSADVLTINANGVTYQIPFVHDIIWQNDKGGFTVNKTRFDEVKI